MKKTDENKMREILMQNRVPEIQPEQVSKARQKVLEQARRESRGTLPKVSLPDRLLGQIPYIAGWVWGVQLFAVFWFAEAARRNPGSVELMVMLILAGPVLALLPMTSLVKSYGCNMWEMEAACRYDLRQITSMHMCIVGAADLAVMAAGCIFYGMNEGSIWEFGLMVLVPFLASSSVYMWELEHFSRRCSGYMLAATGIALNGVFGPGLTELYRKMCENHFGWGPALTVGAAVFFGMAALGCAVRLYRGLEERKGEYERWSLG